MSIKADNYPFGPEDTYAIAERIATRVIAQAIAQARAEGFRLCQERAAATIIDAADANGQIYVMRAAAKVRALKVEGETP